MFTPLLFEMRTVIDWMFTNTSLLFSEWVRVEAIYAQVYEIKCRRMSNKHRYLRGEQYSRLRKYFTGGFILAFLLIILWLPLILFALSPSLTQPNPPKEFKMTLKIGSFEPLYQFEATKANILPFSESDWNSLLSFYERNPAAAVFLRDFQAADVVAVNLNVDSSSSWNVPPENIEKMKEQLKTGEPISAQLKYEIYRPQYQHNIPDDVHYAREISLDNATCQSLVTILEGSGEGLNLPKIFPKLINLQSNSKVRIIPQLISNDSDCKFLMRIVLKQSLMNLF